MPAPYRVGVVGFGMAGATAAYLLARDGHRVTLMERAECVGPVGAGVLLQASGQAILRNLGILDRVIARAAPIDELYARHRCGRTLIRTRYGDLEPGCRAYGVHRGVLFTALDELVRTQPVDVRLGGEIVGRDGPLGDVTLTDAAGRRYGPFDFVLAADGARSRMRDACRMRYRCREYAHGTLWVIGPQAKAEPHLLQVVRGNRQLFGLLPLGDGLATLYWGLPLRETDAAKTRGLDALKADILAFEPAAAELLDSLGDFGQLIVTSYRHVSMRNWSDATTLFLGDAAHAMSPHLGQGINIAMVDGWRFAACLRAAADPSAAFAAFERVQRPYVRYYALLTWLLSPFFQSDWSVLGWARRLGAATAAVFAPGETADVTDRKRSEGRLFDRTVPILERPLPFLLRVVRLKCLRPFRLLGEIAMSRMTDLTAAYLAGLDDLHAAVRGMSREQLLARPVPGKWSTLEVIAHLCDFDPVYAERMKRMIALERPALLGADETLFAKTLAYHDRDLDEELTLMAATRRQMVRILRTLPDSALDRVGIHNERGERTLASLIQGVNDHVASHLKHVADKRAALGVM